jgi:hypothetical protein
MPREDDPFDALERWLNTLAPRTELVARLGLHAHFPTIRGDQSFARRITELVSLLKLDGSDLREMSAEAQMFEAELEHAYALAVAAEDC